MWLVDEAADKGLGAAPPVIVSGLTVMGVSLQDWVYILTIIYILFKIGQAVVTTISKWRNRNNDTRTN